MKWFRFYSEFMDDPKIAMMSDSDQLIWVKALCLASESSTRGEIKLTDEEVCWKLRITLETWKHAIDKFRAKGMLEHSKGGYIITNWGKRQFESDNASQRVAKHRAEKASAKKKQPCNVTRNVTCNVTCNEVVTPPEQIQSTDTEQIQSTEQINTPLIPQGGTLAVLELVANKSEALDEGESSNTLGSLAVCSSKTLESKISRKSSAAARRAKKTLLAEKTRSSHAPEKFEVWWLVFKAHAQKNNCRPGSPSEASVSWDALHEVSKMAGGDISSLADDIINGTEAYWERERLRSNPSVKNGCRFLEKRDWQEALEWAEVKTQSNGLSAQQFAPFLTCFNQSRPVVWPEADESDLSPKATGRLEELVASCENSIERFEKALLWAKRDRHWGLERSLTFEEFLYSGKINEFHKKQLNAEKIGMDKAIAPDRKAIEAAAKKEASRRESLNRLMNNFRDGEISKQELREMLPGYGVEPDSVPEAC